MNKNIENRIKAYTKISNLLDFYNDLRNYHNKWNNITEAEKTNIKICFLHNAKNKIFNALIFLLKEETDDPTN